METAILDPVKGDLEAEILNAASKADRGEDFQLPSASEPEPRATGDTERPLSAESPASSTDTNLESKPDRPRDELGRFTKDAAGNDIPEGERQPAPSPNAKPDKPETPYSKAQKDAVRLARNRQEFEAEKARERAAIAAERQQWEQERQQRQQPPQGQEQGRVYSSREYADFAAEATQKAKQLRAEGDYDGAESQLELAAKATQAALHTHEAEKQQQDAGESEHYQKLWERDMIAHIESNPDLVKDTELSREVHALLGGDYADIFQRIPPIRLPNGRVTGGFGIAAEVARLNLQARSVPVLDAENKKLKAEIERLTGLTSLGRGSATAHQAPKGISDLSSDAQETAILAAAQQFDNGN